MPKLEFSIIIRQAEEMNRVQSLVERFAALYHMPVHLQDLTWDMARQKLNQIAIYKQAVDVSQIGSTWLRDLAEMNALRPFGGDEVARMGPMTDFVPAAWESVRLHRSAEVWAMPWLIDARILFYRRDILKQAGLDESTAFKTPEAFEATLAALRAAGVEVPWVVPTQFSWRTLHTVASWIWAYGGDFVSADGKQLRFAEPAALNGFKAFFRTARYLADEARGLSDVSSDRLFMQGKAAITLSGPWVMEMDAAQLIHVGVTSPPGPAFIGGSHLVIWRHTSQTREAIRLVEYLTGGDAQRRHGFGGLLPARLSALDVVNIPSRDFSRYLTEVLLNGRSFVASHLWALIEERLGQALALLWHEILTMPDAADSTLDELLAQRLGSLAERLTMML